MEGDGKYNIIWKLVEQEGGTPAQGDSIRDLLAKYLTAIGGTPAQGDLFMNLLRKVVIIKGGTPLPGDHEWDLLVKWLQAEGTCRKCGDSVYDLWKKVLALGESDASPEIRVQRGVTVITDGQVSPVNYGNVYQADGDVQIIYTIYNDGDAILHLSGLTVPTGYAVTSPLPANIAPGANATFAVSLINNGLTVGTYAGNINFITNDADENPFSFPITAGVFNPITGIDSFAALGDSPWYGYVAWTYEGLVEHAYFGIELNQDGAGFANAIFQPGDAFTHQRDSDNGVHSWVFRIACFDGDFNRLTDWVEVTEFFGPP